MIAPNPRDRAAQATFERLDAEREKVRLRDGQAEVIGRPLSSEETAWMTVYLKAARDQRDSTPQRGRRRWWRR